MKNSCQSQIDRLGLRTQFLDFDSFFQYAQIFGFLFFTRNRQLRRQDGRKMTAHKLDCMLQNGLKKTFVSPGERHGSMSEKVGLKMYEGEGNEDVDLLDYAERMEDDHDLGDEFGDEDAGDDGDEAVHVFRAQSTYPRQSVDAS